MSAQSGCAVGTIPSCTVLCLFPPHPPHWVWPLPSSSPWGLAPPFLISMGFGPSLPHLHGVWPLPSSSPWGLVPPFFLFPCSNSVFLLFFVTRQVMEATESGDSYSYLIETLKKELVCIKRLFDRFVVSP